jgi:signal transduction histidine kinase
MQVHDSGVGFDPEAQISPPRGWGLAGMRERADSIGGQLHILSAPGEGTLIELRVPSPLLEDPQADELVQLPGQSLDLSEREAGSGNHPPDVG